MRILLAPLLLLAGAFFLWLGLREVARARATLDWPEVDAVIVRSDTVAVDGDSGGMSWEARIEYRYRVGSKTYLCDRIRIASFGGGFRSLVAADTRRYPVGASVRARYDPDAPGAAVLEAGARPATFALMLFGMAFVAFGLMIAAIGVRFRD